MKNIQITIAIALLTMIFTSCDPYYQVEYVIDNQSSQDITIISSFSFQIDSDTSRISSGTRLSIFVEDGIGSTSKERLESIITVQFETLKITNPNGVQFKKDHTVIENWSKEYRKDSDIGMMTLPVTDNDF